MGFFTAGLWAEGRAIVVRRDRTELAINRLEARRILAALDRVLAALPDDIAVAEGQAKRDPPADLQALDEKDKIPVGAVLLRAYTGAEGGTIRLRLVVGSRSMPFALTETEARALHADLGDALEALSWLLAGQ